MRIRSRAAAGAVVAALALTLAGCGQAAEQAAEVAAEQALGGEGQDVEITDEGVTVTDEEGNNVAIGENVAVPDNWPADVPLYDGGTLQMISVQADGSALAMWQVEGTPEEAVAAYTAALESAGYTQDTTANMGGMITERYLGNGLEVSLQALDVDGTTSLTVSSNPAS
jgi:ABC-type Fe3+-hydroxamate transport system substrate-binding protein